MKKQDIPIIIALFALLIAWPQISRKFFPPQQLPPPAEEQPLVTAPTTGTPSKPVITAPAATPVAAPVAEKAEPGAATPVAVSAEPKPVIITHHAGDKPEIALLENDLLALSISSWGGGIKTVSLKDFRSELDTESEPLLMDFSSRQALTYNGITELSTANDFTIRENRTSVELTKDLSSGVKFVRTISITNSYVVSVTDRFINSAPQSNDVPAHGLNVGPMEKVATTSRSRGMASMGIDSLPQLGGEDVIHWAKSSKLSKTFLADANGGFGCFSKATFRIPVSIETNNIQETAWVAVKNKFFTQVLEETSEEPGAGFTMYATRVVPDEEEANPDDQRFWPKAAELGVVSAALNFPALSIGPGEEVSHTFIYYVGPKKYDILKTLGKGDVMEFGFWTPVCRILLPALNYVHMVVPNYGLAIIILTIIIRILFWPVMKKSTENMKKMQAIQPDLKALKEKYGDGKDQQVFLKKQQALFKEHKVNPLGGCLPLLIQIPVFIALFRVLNSAVELRFAEFLWIKDLSEQEGLMAGVLPFPINILPLLMTATMVWQQKLTPSAGDPQQQKMMAIFMPLMMLMLFYSMPSALVLYWTTSQSLSILQLALKNRSDKKKADDSEYEEVTVEKA